MTSQVQAARRSPRGVVTEKPIPIRLLPAERAEVAAIAQSESRSLASMSRLMLLRGLADFRAKNAATAN
ncbi:hypothetical protein [Curvibacter gracilis]|uniref:hypothetical protein n=1 Tax=Curvibacter gracilis TaxID=230310 RepID=UPI000A01BF37|nr:hypothetical protein [Curvibacter gracilis]